MVVAAFVAPYLLDATTRFVEAAARVPDTELALVTCEPEGNVPSGLRRSLAAHWRIDDALDTGQITSAVQGVSERIGPVQRLLAVLEQLQVPVAQAREHLSIAGMDAGTARNFRDKAQMKSVLRAAGVPCARHRLADSAAAAAGFAKDVRSEYGDLADEVLAVAMANRLSLTALVRSEVEVAITALGLVPVQKLEEVQAEAARLRAENARLRSASSRAAAPKAAAKKAAPRRTARTAKTAGKASTPRSAVTTRATPAGT